MKRAKGELPRPHGVRHFTLLREGPEGTVWWAADGMVVRVAAAERRRAAAREAEALDMPPVGESGSRRGLAW
jgi:hypothetical protein